MKELHIKNKNFMLVEVPEEYEKFKISGTDYLCGAENKAWQAIPPRLDQGWDYVIIGLIEKLTNNQVKDLVECNLGLYRNYLEKKWDNIYQFESPLDSFVSLLKSKNIDISKKFLLVERFEQYGCQTIQELADRFYTRYSVNDKDYNLSSNVYNERLCKQIRELVEYHVKEALVAASQNAETEIELANPYDSETAYSVVNKMSILNSYPLENIK